MKLVCSCFVLVSLSVNGTIAADGEELLVNGDLEVGVPEDDKPSSFVCKGWRRLLWKETEPNSWLTCGERDWQVGKGNQALEYRWGATSVCQFFSARPGETYQFSVEYLNPGSADSRWQPRIQVEWWDANAKPIGAIATVVEADYTTAPVKKWNKLEGSVKAPPNTAYGRVLLNVNNKGAGQYFQRTYLDNASVRGVPGAHNLPVSFISSPYDLSLDAIFESTPFRDSLANYADDRDEDPLTFTRISGPDWLTVQPDGELGGTPRFEDAGDNKLAVKVEDGRGSSETRTLTIPVIGFLRLGNLFDDDMVLQRNAPISVWGKAPANQSVRVRMSTGESTRTVANETGDWIATLPAMEVTVSDPVTMSVTSGSRELRLQNLLVGDVWFCSGQSNMSWPLIHSDDSEREIASARFPNLRLLRTPETRSAIPWQDLTERAAWLPCSPDTVSDFSAVAYYFGKSLQSELQIPIGLINSSQGGTRIESWAVGLLPTGSDTLYNSRVHPYTRMPIKGVIWYQAEANIADGHAYTGKMKTLVDDWRKAWDGDEFPFYFVQLAPFDYRGDSFYQLPELWVAQTAAMRLIRNSGMVVINDVGNVENIHPTNKASVGERLALWALHETYGHTDLVHTGPLVSRVAREGKQLRIEFNNSGSGLTSRDGQPLTWFEVAGMDKAFVPATAKIDGTSLVVCAAQVPEPRWVRFAWHEIAQPNLMNAEGLPANSFVRQCNE